VLRVRTVHEVGAVPPIETRYGRHTLALRQRGNGVVSVGNFGAHVRCGVGALVQACDYSLDSRYKTSLLLWRAPDSSARTLRASR
jgi:hypothetical protein